RKGAAEQAPYQAGQIGAGHPDDADAAAAGRGGDRSDGGGCGQGHRKQNPDRVRRAIREYNCCVGAGLRVMFFGSPTAEQTGRSKMASRWLRLLAGGAVTLAMALGAAGPAAARDLVVALKTEPSSLDPQYHALTPNTQISQTLFDPLVRADSKLQPQPALAESWTVDGNVWTFKLRPDVKFSDGTPFTSEDVVFTYDRIPK